MDEINALPDHVLAEIFGYLSPKMIKSCSLVCKRWDEIIGNSRELMGRFQLDLYKHSSYSAIQEAKQIKRKHQGAIVEILWKDSLDVISRHKLQSLTLNNAHLKLSALKEALNRSPSLKFLDSNYFEYIDDIFLDYRCKKVQMNLKKLRCDNRIIRIYECFTVKELKTIWCYPVDDDRKKLAIDFLRRQKYLEELSIVGYYSSEFFTMPDIFDLKFALTKFEYSYRDKLFLHYEAFIKFLQQHKRTLTSLKVNFCTEPKFGIELIHKFALENLVNLKHLELGYQHKANEIGSELSFDELSSATQVTKNIESLKLNARSTDMNENKRFFTMFPNLKTLNIENLYGNEFEVLFCISEININVETLEMYTLDDKTETDAIIYFPKLKEFSVRGFYSEVNLSSFINRHSKTLEKITLKRVDDITHLTTKEILNCASLKCLDLYFWRPNFSIMGMLNEISLKTKPFTLILQDLSSEKKSTFIFPDDKAIWDEKVEKLKNEIHATAARYRDEYRKKLIITRGWGFETRLISILL